MNPNIKKKPSVILVMGGPASGKGTYCKKLSEDFGLIHLSIGDILREERTKNNESGKFLDYHMTQFETTGKLMPPEIISQYLFMELTKHGWEKNSYLIDGVIKARGGYDCWMKMFSKIVDMKFVLYLECSEPTMMNRLHLRSETSGRIDDNQKLFLTRIRTFFDRTYPCVELFAAEGMVLRISTENTIENVYSEIKNEFLKYFALK
jgi:adenylate kinase family enzyme